MGFIILGYIFILFDFTINNFDIINDVIGFIFILVGVFAFKHTEYVNFPKIIPLAIVGMISSAIIQFTMSTITDLTIFSITLSIVTPILLILISMYIVKGVKEIEDEYKSDLGHRKLKILWTADIIIFALCMLFEYTLVWLSTSHSVILFSASAIVLGVGRLVLEIIFVIYLFKTSRLIKNNSNYNTVEEDSYERYQHIKDTKYGEYVKNIKKPEANEDDNDDEYNENGEYGVNTTIDTINTKD